MPAPNAGSTSRNNGPHASSIYQEKALLQYVGTPTGKKNSQRRNSVEHPHIRFDVEKSQTNYTLQHQSCARMNTHSPRENASNGQKDGSQTKLKNRLPKGWKFATYFTRNFWGMHTNYHPFFFGHDRPIFFHQALIISSPNYVQH